MDKGDRGNFHAIKLEEVDCIRNQFCSNLIPQTFQSSKIFGWISQIKGQEKNSIKNKEMEESFIIDRLTRICYILVKMNLLKIEKQSGSVFFAKNLRLHNQIITIDDKEELLNQQYKQISHRIISHKPIKIEIDPSKNSRINKKKKSLKKCPYCNADVCTRKYEKHIKLRCPKRPKGVLENQ
jgi:hypothetical protein